MTELQVGKRYRYHVPAIGFDATVEITELNYEDQKIRYRVVSCSPGVSRRWRRVGDDGRTGFGDSRYFTPLEEEDDSVNEEQVRYTQKNPPLVGTWVAGQRFGTGVSIRDEVVGQYDGETGDTPTELPVVLADGTCGCIYLPPDADNPVTHVRRVNPDANESAEETLDQFKARLRARIRKAAEDGEICVEGADRFLNSIGLLGAWGHVYTVSFTVGSDGSEHDVFTSVYEAIKGCGFNNTSFIDVALEDGE